MKKIFFAAVLVIAPQMALGATFNCSLVDDFDDWSVEVTVTEDVQQARFFDNDHWSTLTDYEFRLLESHPPQKVHHFYGTDSRNTDNKLSFSLNETRLTATLVDEFPGEESQSYAMTCQPVDVASQCYDLLTHGGTTDARSLQIHTDRFDHELEDGRSALAVIQIALHDLGCAPGSAFGGQDQAAACREVVPKNVFSNLCYVEINLGYFTVHETLPESLMITFSRWD